ncbi:MAG: helix-turn-helix transcriptional regulator [bacterium]|nr:helix-turn-helix transcriptional regulator [bacterium]
MKTTLKEEVGGRMRKLRRELGYTQAEMVSHFNIGRANYSRIEKGEVFPNARVLSILKTKFGVSLDWLICGEGRMAPHKDNGDSLEVREEIPYMVRLMEAHRMVRHAVLGFFLEYTSKNKELLPQT